LKLKLRNSREKSRSIHVALIPTYIIIFYDDRPFESKALFGLSRSLARTTIGSIGMAIIATAYFSGAQEGKNATRSSCEVKRPTKKVQRIAPSVKSMA
jgi:hypothetical protein